MIIDNLVCVDLEPQEKSTQFSHKDKPRTKRDITIGSNRSVDEDPLSCRRETSCVGKCRKGRDPGLTTEEIKCFCDEYCTVFLDCCADYEQFCLLGKHSNSSKSLNHEFWKCHDRGGSTMPFAKGVRMISACPENWTYDEIATKCTRDIPEMSEGSQSHTTPLIDAKNNTYKNRFCAVCHGVEFNTSRFYDHETRSIQPVSYTKRENTTNSTSVVFKSSIVKWKPPLGAHRRYCLDLETNASCLNTSVTPEVQRKCLSKSPGVVGAKRGTRKLYLNRHCAQCAGVALGEIVCGPIKQSAPKLLSSIKGPQVVSSLITLFRPDSRKPNPCEIGHVLDPVSRECRRVISMKRDIDKKLTLPFFNRYKVSIEFESQFGKTDGNQSRKVITQTLESALRNCSAEILSINVLNGTSISANIVVTFPQSYLSQTNGSITCNLTVGNMPFSVAKEEWVPLLCVTIDIYNPSEYLVITNADSAIYVNSTKDKILKTDYWSNQTESRNGSVIPVGDVHVCRKSVILKCFGVLIQLKEEEYVILGNGSLYRNNSKEVYGIHDFVMIDGEATICIIPSSADSNTYTALLILTYVGISLSIACLLLVLFTYSIFRELRTLPGINLMNLSISLLFAHSFFMIGGVNQQRQICTLIAVLTHYFYLAYFTWMSIIAFDTYYTFSRTCRTRQRTANRKGCLLAIGWIPALLFVAICYYLDQSGLVAIGYGGTSHCWINNTKSNIFVFVIPVAVSILLNAILFSLTVISINKIKKQTRVIGNAANNRKQVVLFLKLSVLMGFTWIFGYLSILVSSYFDYPFVVFNSLQRVFIAFGFVFTGRVKKMYGALLTADKVLSSTTQTYDTQI